MPTLLPWIFNRMASQSMCFSHFLLQILIRGLSLTSRKVYLDLSSQLDFYIKTWSKGWLQHRSKSFWQPSPCWLLAHLYNCIWLLQKQSQVYRGVNDLTIVSYRSKHLLLCVVIMEHSLITRFILLFLNYLCSLFWLLSAPFLWLLIPMENVSSEMMLKNWELML